MERLGGMLWTTHLGNYCKHLRSNRVRGGLDHTSRS